MILFIRKIAFTCLLQLLLIPFPAKSQTDTLVAPAQKLSKNLALQAVYENGYVFATNPFLRGINSESTKIDDIQSFSLKLSHQSTGKKQWEQLYRYPEYGIGLYVADFFNPEEIGTPIAVYGFLNAPFARKEKLTFNYEIRFGASFNWKAFNPLTNKYNISIGAGESFLIYTGLNLQYQLTHKVALEAGFGLTHFSNGNMKKPNFGINSIAPNLSVKYNFYDSPTLIRHEIPVYEKEYEWIVDAFVGFKNIVFDSIDYDLVEKYEGVYYPVFGISSTINRQLSYKSKLGMGMTFTYNGSVNAQAFVEGSELELTDGRIGEKLMISIYPSYELVINKASIIIQPAFYLYRKKLNNQSPVFHQRIGLKYHISDHLFIGMTLVDYKFHVSDFVEWNVGYRLKW